MTPFLRAPPFPGRKPVLLSRRGDGDAVPEQDIVTLLRNARVGGTYWAAQAAIAPDTILACPWDAASAQVMIARAAGAPLLFWARDSKAARAIGALPSVPLIGAYDPWHMAEHASEIWGDSTDERVMIARILKRPAIAIGSGSLPDLDLQVREAVTRALVYVDPFTGTATGAVETIHLLSYWRDLIDANRPIKAATGIAFWKRETVAPLLWGGGAPVRYLSNVRALENLPADAAIAVWKSKTPADLLTAIEARNVPLHEVEDGFIRSIGLGADCVPPLSITVDAVGVHFDPSGPSGLEMILNEGRFDATIIARATEIRRMIVDAGLSKYGISQETLVRPGGDRRHILVTGQVEDDRSVIAARGDVAGNLDLLRRARAAEPDACLIYRPHPDVDAGHRTGHVPDEIVLTYADAIDRGTSISALLDMVDGVHVLSSLAGFEALLRGRDVTCHGTPFYAGWGLTRDLGTVPKRRQARLDVNALAAGVLLHYPRYLDPVTNLPCPPEILVQRLIAGIKKESRFIVPLRKLQGKVNRWRFRAGSVETG